MLSTIWHPWEDIRTKGDAKAENRDKGYKKPAVSDEMQKLFLTCYDYFYKSTLRKYGALIVIFLENLYAGPCNLNKNEYCCK